MGKLYGSSAPLSQTFTFNGNAPIDDRIAVKSIDDLQSINAYKGLFVFVEDENEYYSYTLNNIYEYEWQKAQFGSSGEVTGAVYETLLALQAEVAKLRNSFLYGITSYQGEDTAASSVAKEIEDTAVVVPESYTHSSYGAGVYGGVTNNITAPGYRFYQPNSSERIYYACDVSKNVYFPRAANRGANIRYIIQGSVWTSTDSNRYTYKVYEQINQYGEGNYSTFVSLYL